jgi:hypothetical protein
MKDFPKLRQYVSVALPVVQTVKPIIAAIKKFAGEIDEATIKQALVWGKGPMLKVVEMDPLGQFTPNSNSNEIRLQKDMVKEFERGKGLRKTASGHLVYLVGVTILHELTHWADDQDGVDTAGEEGELYEKEVYGKVIV